MRVWPLALALLGCAHLQAVPDGLLPGAPRLYRVSDGIYRSGQPSPAQFAELVRTLGIKSVVKLNSRVEAHDALPDGVEFFHHPWLPAGPVSADQVQAALIDLDAAPRPVLVHCTEGVDRTGLLIAVHRVLREHAAKEAALGEWRAYGRNPALVFFTEAFEHATEAPQ